MDCWSVYCCTAMRFCWLRVLYRSAFSLAFFWLAASCASLACAVSSWIAKGRGSIWMSTSPFLTCWPSTKSTLSMRPSTCVFTVTV